MAKLCPKGKAAAKRKFKVYPSAYANIAAKKARIKAGSGEKMRKKGAKGAPTAKNFKRAKQTARS